MTEPRDPQRWFDVAVIGMAGRWPGASGPAELWRLLSAGVDALRPFSDDELRERGVDERRLRDPQFVKAGAVLDGADRFAAPFFGYSPREAALMDPQHRLFLEAAWEALEDAGYAPRHVPGQVGVFASCGLSGYLLFNLVGNPAVDEKDETFQAMIGADKDFVATRVSYKLNLTGPSVSIQTGCSSSLVAVGLAVQSLLTYQSDVALAGGVAVAVRQRTGYWHQPGGIASPDGHCRPFAADAAGTVFADGVGVIALKRLGEALRDGDQIYAVVRSVAVNNDGSAKVGYTAPSVGGQSDVIRRALALADVEARSIGYVEAHGTATALGDPAEIAALTEAFGGGTGARGFCAIGSVKGNIGHLDAAAGVTGLIKTILMLKHRALVPSLHFGAPNPRIDFARTPFYVNTTLTDWIAADGPRRAGVSSFGIGGTNAHAVLEEAPERPRAGTPRAAQLLTLSAESPAALEAATDRLAAFLADTPEASLADVAFTCQVGREAFRHRRAVVCESVSQAAERLRTRDRELVHSGEVVGGDRVVVFMFPGGGAQYAGMGRELYAAEPVFRAAVDRCADCLARIAPIDLRQALYPSQASHGPAAPDRLAAALPAIFTTSYAMVQLLASWGVRPAAMIGHSLGEYVAACVAGVLSLEDALGVVALRGRLIDSVPEGAMLSVYAGREEIESFGLADVCVAAVNAPDNCVIAGSTGAIARAEAALADRDIECRRLRINAAAHSPAVEPVIEPLRERLRAIPLRPPAIPYISNLTGTWIAPEEATDPDRWARHLRQPVLFAAGIAELARAPQAVFVDVGPGRTLGSLARAQLKPGADRTAPAVVAMMKHPHEDRPDGQALCEGAARLWTAGVELDWRQVGAGDERRRVSLPTYPFVRGRYWIDPPSAAALARADRNGARGVDDWCYLPGWRRALPPRSTQVTGADRSAPWLIFSHDGAASNVLCERLRSAGVRAVVVEAGPRYECVDAGRYVVDPASADDYRLLLRAAREGGDRAIAIHLWCLPAIGRASDWSVFAGAQRTGLVSLVSFAQAAGREGVQVDVLVVASQVEQVGGTDPIDPARAPLRAACTVLPQELDGVRCRLVDLVAPGGEAPAGEFLADCVIAESAWDDPDDVAAYRAAQRSVRQYEPVRVPPSSGGRWLREGGVYLLVGGTGQIGLTLAQAFARRERCTLVLTGRTGAGRSTQGAGGTALAGAIDAIESGGSQVAVYAANAADLTRMQEVVAEVERRWGRIDGIVHLAGVTGAAALQPASDLTVEDFAVQFEPKVGGAYVLARIVDSRPVDFCVTFSSTASILGGVGMLPYAAANAFLDGLATTRARGARSPRWISVNWDGWLTPDAVHGGNAALARHAMQPADAIEVLDRLLSGPVSGQVVVSTGDLQERIAEWRRPRQQWLEPIAADAPRPALASDYVAPETPLERDVAEVWSGVLGIAAVGVHDNLFELGGNSLVALRIVSRLKRKLAAAVPVTALFEAPTVHLLARWLSERLGEGARGAEPAAAAVEGRDPARAPAERVSAEGPGATARDGTREPAPVVPASGIAIVGLAGRFPGAENVAEFWRGLAGGLESIRRAADDAPPRAGGGEAGRFVRATATLPDYESFDAGFFGMTPAEAALRDPQHRVFLEQAWAAVENAGYDCRRYHGRVGVFGGTTTNTYLTRNIGSRPDVLAAFDPVQINVANGPDFLTTLVSYKLNLTGPSHTVQSACSTSLVAVHCACRSLENRECDMALAGGVSVNLMLADGYRYVEGGMLSADGRCRAFDAGANGTVFGSGAAVVVLKRLEDAIADGDWIHAVIIGSAVNNDGGVKAGYTAPSVEGEARVIEDALRAARVGPETISYVECHGTGTPLGDPIEVRALTRAYGTAPVRPGACALGSVKTNVGHLDAAAGVTGLIKAVASLEHGLLAPSLHYTRANPEIDFAATPFYVNTKLQAWRPESGVRRAGVSAFGVGGTNAHVIVEEAPARAPSGPSRAWQLLVWSAKTADAVGAVAAQLAAAVRETDAGPLADVAFTLQTGRQRMPWRRAVVCADAGAAAEALESGAVDAARDGTGMETAHVAFVFPDHGAAPADVGRELYMQERVYRETIDLCAAAVRDELGADLRDLLYAPAAPEAVCEARVGQPALVATSYALARLWMSWGVRPVAMLGRGAGEYVAASIAGVWPIENALRLAVERGRVMDAWPRPAAADAGEAGAGRSAGDEAWQPAVASLAAAVARVPRGRIAIPCVSSLTGTWITGAEIQDPEYWARQARTPVPFDRGLETLVAGGPRFVLEVGPGRELSRLVRRRGGVPAAASLDGSARSEQRALLETLGQLWTAGVDIDWRGFYADERRRRVPLPTYPFQRARHWIDPGAASDAAPAPASQAAAAGGPAAPPKAPRRANRPALRNAYVAPRDSTERAVVEVVESALGIHPVGVTDRFGELGGDSLQAVRIIDAINARLHVHLRVIDLYDDVTIRDVVMRVLGDIEPALSVPGDSASRGETPPAGRRTGPA